MLESVGQGWVRARNCKPRDACVRLSIKNSDKLDGLEVDVRAWLVTDQSVYVAGTVNGNSPDFGQRLEIGPSQREDLTLTFPSLQPRLPGPEWELERIGQPAYTVVQVIPSDQVAHGSRGLIRSQDLSTGEYFAFAVPARSQD